MITIIVLVIVYLISTYGAWKLTQIAYSKGGRWESICPEIGDAIFVVTPIFSTITVLFLLIGGVSKKPRNMSNFFKVKK